MDVTIVITAYRYGRFLREALESALLQEDAGEFEVVVVYRSSGDETEEILATYAGDARMRVIEQRGRGLAQGANLGIEAARGQYVVRLDADDLFLSGIVAQERAFLDAHPEVDFVYPDYVYRFDAEGRCVRKHLPLFDPDELRSRGDFLSGGTMYRRDLFDRVGLYDESLTTLESYEFILRLLEHGAVGHHLDEALFEYRIHGESMSDDVSHTERVGRDIAARYGLEYAIGEHHPRDWRSGGA